MEKTKFRYIRHLKPKIIAQICGLVCKNKYRYGIKNMKIVFCNL